MAVNLNKDTKNILNNSRKNFVNYNEAEYSAKSRIFDEYPYSLSYQETTLIKFSVKATPAFESNTEVCVSPTKS